MFGSENQDPRPPAMTPVGCHRKLPDLPECPCGAPRGPGPCNGRPNCFSPIGCSFSCSLRPQSSARRTWNAIAPQSKHWMPCWLEHADLLLSRLRWVFEWFSVWGVGASAVARHGLSVASTIYFRVAGRGRVPQRTRLWRRGRPTWRGQRRARCGTLASIDVSGGLDGCPRSCVPIEIFWVKYARERGRELHSGSTSSVHSCQLAFFPSASNATGYGQPWTSTWTLGPPSL